MKNTILTLSILLLSFTSCNKDNDDSKQQENSIYGTWKLVEAYGSDGGNPGQWHPVENGYTYTFARNGTFTTTKFSECDFGDYVLSNNTLTLIFGCEGFTTGIESPEGTFVENYVFDNGNIILSPTYLFCDEGCDYKFQKIE